MENKEVRQVFIPEQKFEIWKDIKTFKTVKESLENTTFHIRRAGHGRGHQGVFEIIGAELSLARVRRPADNAITE